MSLLSESYGSMTLTQLRALESYKTLPRSVKKSTLKRAELIKVLATESVAETPIWKCKETYHETDLQSILKDTLKAYYEHGNRSSKKVDYIHFFINCLIRKRIAEMAPKYHKYIRVQSQPFSEVNVGGLLYNKNVDITVQYKTNNVGLVSVKFITSNYKQNANNYFETMVGECINLKTTKLPRVFWYSMFIFQKTPYYNVQNEVQRYENIDIDHDLNNYKRIYALRNMYKNLPDCISMSVVKNTDVPMLHPKKAVKMSSEEIENYIQRLLEGGIAPSARFGFWQQLDQFCQKTVDTIRFHYDPEGRTRLPMGSV